ncbi:hypothetical protein [uncultured Porphyromonas sp.]|nr:hypothetical protein [uncultured Porphyromonas sp.]
MYKRQPLNKFILSLHQLIVLVPFYSTKNSIFTSTCTDVVGVINRN